jgi:ABC-type transport system substrate-binding protein
MSSKFSVTKRLLLTLAAISTLVSAFYIVPNASAAAGPQLSYHKFLTIKTPDAQVKAMKLGQIQMYPGLIRPGDVDELSAAGKKIVSTPGGHFCYITFNLREYDLGGGVIGAGNPPDDSKRCLLDVNFRHAMAYLVPKEILIGTIFKYIVGRIDSVIPPQFALWSNPNIPIFNFAPGNPFTSNAGDADACGTLKAGGYFFQDRGTLGSVDAQDYWSYDAAGNDPLGTLEFLSPSYEEAPTSYTIVQTTAAEMNAIGLNNIHHLGVNFTDMLDQYVYPNTFDMFFLCWSGLSNDPDNLWAFFNSANDLFQGRNHPGIHSAVIDELTNTIHNSLDINEVKAASDECQALLMSPTDYYGLSYIPIYSRNYFDAYDADLQGIVNMPFTGSNNGWTLLNAHWKTTGGPMGDNGLVEVVGTDVLTLNPLTSNSADEVNVWGSMFDGMIVRNPYTTADTLYGMASAFSYGAYTGTSPVGYVDGMVFHYTIKPGVTWQDGLAFTANDIKFDMDYLAANEPALYTDAWQDYVGVNIVSTSQVDIYYNRTSLWLKDGLSGYVCLLAPQIWNDANRDGTQGDIVTDWQHYNVWEYDHPPIGGVVPKVPGTATNMKCLVGTGPWVFETLNVQGGWSQIRAYPGYYLTQAQVSAYLTDMFHWYGNVNTGEETSEKVDIQDVALEGIAWGSYNGGARWDQRCDLVVDNFIDAEDLRVVGAAYGKQKVYP